MKKTTTQYSKSAPPKQQHCAVADNKLKHAGTEPKSRRTVATKNERSHCEVPPVKPQWNKW